MKCLGLEFENDDARRAHFTEELCKKLQYPEFRKIEGFPIGEDEDILKLSDPPYYTACPNPWIADFIEEWESQKPEKPADYHYHREPFAADVSEGKNDPIYCAHSYHTKVPHKAINGKVILNINGEKKTCSSLSGASLEIAGNSRNGWRDWYLCLPGQEQWILAADWRREQ